MTRIMIIRHAEKHANGGFDRGVNIEGVHTKHELTVRGWQRAGALARFFAPAEGPHPNPMISAPRSIFASASTKRSPSLRPLHTVGPLAALLGIQIDVNHACGEEASVVAAALAAASPALIVWHHSHICELARLIAGEHLGWPPHWPEDRFDVVWVLDRPDDAAGPWRFSQVAQRLFASDRAHGI